MDSPAVHVICEEKMFQAEEKRIAKQQQPWQ
jgi:hypothetical protein